MIGDREALFGCDLIPLNRFSDERGFLVPVWSQGEVSQQYVYYSVTYSGQARDPDRWHIHKDHIDRFVVLTGTLLFGLSDGHETEVVALSGRDPKMLIVPSGVYHCLNNRWGKDSLCMNIPSRIYDPEDEGRVPFDALDTRHPW